MAKPRLRPNLAKHLLPAFIFLFSISVASAEEPPAYPRSIIYVFRNNDECFNCDKAITMLQNLYEENYKTQYDFYIINYQTEYLDNDYINTYHLSEPLEVVLAKVENGRGAGYRKLELLENRTSNELTFDREVSDRIDVFLGGELR